MATGFQTPERGSNLLDTGAHFYDVYQCSDGKYISIGSIEPQFYAELIQKLDLDPDRFAHQMDRNKWPELKDEIVKVVSERSRDEWDEILAGSDVCYAPVLTVEEAMQHPHNIARNTFTEVGGLTQPMPAPRLSITPGEIQGPPAHPGQHTDEILEEAGMDAEILRASGVVA